MHLTDCFMELVAYVVYFRKTVNLKQPPYEQVKADIMRLLTQSEICLKKDFFSQEDYDQARFVICAWVDETILGSSWNEKNRWQTEQLQRIYYNITDAGEEVFNRLNALGLHQRDIREVYYLCLSLGFTGRYCHKGDEYLIEQLKTSNLKLLAGTSVGLPSLERTELFPEAYPSGAVGAVGQKRKPGFTLFNIIIFVSPVLLFSLLYFIYRIVLDGVGKRF
ncbi:MAG TPA: DotU family type IV/VI secretion system protein [Nitrospirae bacterium]|nr:DotU family type IV/VI secretion system protein [Nitrospirota bacterium]HDH04227.1 DotU family type IV/VI secretion system protein [Nitrospirota bacterium]